LRKLLAKSLAIFGLLPCFLYSGQGPEVKNGPVTTRLVTESNVKPESSSFEIGWWIKREKGWHTYWESPGDVGVPPILKWNLPKGIILREMHYAPPQLVKMFKVFAHGHKDESLFIFRFDVKRKLQHGDELSFGAKQFRFRKTLRLTIAGTLIFGISVRSNLLVLRLVGYLGAMRRYSKRKREKRNS